MLLKNDFEPVLAPTSGYVEASGVALESSVDHIALNYRVCIRNGHTNAPALWVGGSYSPTYGKASEMSAATLRAFADMGYAVFAANSRERENAGGTRDDGAREAMDVVDVLRHFREAYAGLVHPRRFVMNTYSGSGLIAANILAKFPGLASLWVPFFAPIDLAMWHAEMTAAGQVAIVSLLESAMGGAPAAVPAAYQARNGLDALGHVFRLFPTARVIGYQDAEDGLVPPHHLKRLDAILRDQMILHLSSASSSARWTHGTPDSQAHFLTNAQALPFWGPLGVRQRAFDLPRKGVIRVLGYAVLEQLGLTVWTGSAAHPEDANSQGGKDRVLTVAYDVDEATLQLLPENGDQYVYAELQGYEPKYQQVTGPTTLQFAD